MQAATVLEDHDVTAHAATLLERREVEMPKLLHAESELASALAQVRAALAQVSVRLRVGDKALHDQAQSLLCCSLYAVQAATVLEDHDVTAHAATLLERREVDTPKLLHAESEMTSSLAEVSET